MQNIENDEPFGLPIIRVTNTIFLLALKDNIKKIRVEESEKECLVWLDERCQMKLALYWVTPLIERLQTMANINIEAVEPQHGTIQVTMHGNSTLFQVETSSLDGARVVLTR